MVGEIRTMLTPGTPFTIRKAAGKATTINELTITSNGAGSITITDGTQTDIIYTAGTGPKKLDYCYTYSADADVTITGATVVIGIYGTYKQR